jgi:hypothetical protein
MLPFRSLSDTMRESLPPMGPQRRLGRVTGMVRNEDTSSTLLIDDQGQMQRDGRMLLDTRSPATPTAGAPNIMEILQQQHAPLQSMINQQFNDAETQVHSTIENDRKTMREKYALQREAIEKSSVLDTTQKQAKIEQLNLSFDEQMLDLRGKIRPDLEALAGKRKHALAKADLDMFEAQTQMHTIQQLIEGGVLAPEEGRRQQLRIAGISLPESALRPQKVYTPLQRLRELGPILREWEGELGWYRRKPDEKTRFGGTRPGGEWQEYDEQTKTYGVVTPEKGSYLDDLERRIQTLRPQVQELQQTVVGDNRLPPRLSVAGMPGGSAPVITRVVGGRVFRKVGPDTWETQ